MDPIQLGNGMEFEVAKLVTLPFLVMANDEKYYIRFDSAIEPDKSTFSERVRKSKTSDGQPQNTEPIHIALVTNMQAQSPARLVAHAVLESNLDEAYPNKGYVSKIFQIQKTKAQGKRYFNFEIVELRLKGSSDAAKTSAPKR